MTISSQADFAAVIRADRQVWRDLVSAVGPDRFEEPGPMGDWSFRDLAGHLLGWRNRSIARLEAVVRREPQPSSPWPEDLEDDDEVNDWIRDHDQDRSTQELIDAYDASFERLAAAIDALPAAVFERPADFGWAGEGSIADIDPTGHLHDEHLPTVREWLAAQ